MESHSNKRIPEKELPRYRKSICWFCKNHCDSFGYTHKACIIDYFSKPKPRQLLLA
jgi:hypothetical protein